MEVAGRHGDTTHTHTHTPSTCSWERLATAQRSECNSEKTLRKLLEFLSPVCVCVCVFSQGGELAHVGEGIIRQEADLIVAQISAENKGQRSEIDF